MRTRAFRDDKRLAFAPLHTRRRKRQVRWSRETFLICGIKILNRSTLHGAHERRNDDYIAVGRISYTRRGELGVVWVQKGGNCTCKHAINLKKKKEEKKLGLEHVVQIIETQTFRVRGTKSECVVFIRDYQGIFDCNEQKVAGA